MKNHTILAAAIVVLTILGTAQASSPQQAAAGLLGRLLPGRSQQFVLETIPPEATGDVFEVQSVDGKIVIRGSNGVAIASGLNWYLNQVAHCQVSFCGDQLALADPPPPVPEKVRRTSPLRYRYCFNYCAYSYTMAFWDWPQWERMIDWMALHGINLPLAMTGQEAVWQKVGRDLGLRDEQLREFLVGPAYLPFGWMGCIDGWGGPLPDSWIKSHAELQKKILARQRELGMTPVLQGFTGHVPASLIEVFPQARLQKLPSWCGFPGTSFLDPNDPLFQRIGKAFVEEQTRQFGTDHLYAADTFIEMTPPSPEPEFLDAMGKAVHRAMTAADPQAIWVMQGWIFVNNPGFWKPSQTRALLRSVPDDRMLVLDLYCETQPAWSRTESFCGKPWVYCIIQSFGARVSLHAGLPQIAGNLRTALASPDRGKLSGIGLIMEGFGYNPAAFDFLTDMTWRTEVPDLEAWLKEYTKCRYGRSSLAAEDAWHRLYETAYRMPGHVDSLICGRPGLNLHVGTPYDPAALAEVCQRLLAAGDELATADTYRYDVVHILRQVLSNVAVGRYAAVVDAYRKKDSKALTEAGERFVELIRDLDDLLATRREFLLGRWLEDSKRWGTDEAERNFYQWNARNLITFWGPRDSVLHEYSEREWSGMLRGFYLPRWELMLARLQQSLADDKPLDAARLEADLRAWEERWTHGVETYPTAPQGDPLAVARRLWQKYRREATPPRDAVSLTTGKPTTCSAALPQHLASLANDGRAVNTDRYWATDPGSQSPSWWQVDLEQPTNLGRVVVVLYYGDRRHYGFTVEGSLDGKTWDMLADHRNNQEPSTSAGTTCTFPPHPVRCLRVTINHNSANTGRHLVEVMAYEK